MIYTVLFSLFCLSSVSEENKNAFLKELLNAFFKNVKLSKDILKLEGDKIYYKGTAIWTFRFNAEFIQFPDKFDNYIDGIFNRIFREIIKLNDFEDDDIEIGTIINLWQEKFKIDEVYETDFSKIIAAKIKDDTYLGPLVIVGESASGKTTATRFALSKLKYTYIDMAAIMVAPASFLTTIINSTEYEDKRSILVIDNIHANPGSISWIPKIIAVAKNLTGIGYLPIFITWPIALNNIAKVYGTVDEIHIDGNIVISSLISSYNLNKFESDIKKNCRGDVLASKQFISYVQENEGRLPNQIELAKDVYIETCKLINTEYDFLPKKENEALFLLSCINQFEVHVAKIYFEKSELKDAVVSLKEKGLIKYYKDDGDTEYFSIGHRSKAYFIYIYLQSIAKNEEANRNERRISLKYADIKAEEIVIDYLKEVGFDEQLYNILQRLDLNRANPLYSKLWKRFEKIKDNLKKQCSDDITWGNNMASMIFACNAFAAMKYDASFGQFLKPTEKRIYERWSFSEDGKSLVFIGDEMTAEMDDFKIKIAETMKADEALRAIPVDQKTDAIDFDLFHHSWLLGLLLGEAGPNPDSKLKTKLVKVAEAMQEIDGNYYPKRVPWVTARVILGLVECGYTYITNKIVKDACDWLVEQLTDAISWPIENMVSPGWYSGTGTWNSNEQITIMNLCALIAAHYPIYDNEKVSQAIDEFTSHYKELNEFFCNNKAFLDSMWIVDLLVKSKMPSNNYIPLLLEITDIALSRWNSAVQGVNEKDNESSDMAFLAKELLDIIWKLLSDNIGQIISKLNFTYDVKQRKKSIFLSYRRDTGGFIVQTIWNKLNKFYPNDVFLDVNDLNKTPDDNGFLTAIKDAITNSEIYVIILSVGCYDRVFDSKYDLEKDVLYQEMKFALDNHIHIIPVIGGQTFFDNLSKLEAANKEFYNALSNIISHDAVTFNYNKVNGVDDLINDLKNKINAYKK